MDNKTKKANQYIDPYAEIVKAKWNILFIVFLITLIAIFRLEFVIIYCIILLWIILRDVFKKEDKNFWGLVKKILFASVLLWALYFAMKFFGTWWGIFGIIFVLVCFGGLVIYTRRGKYMAGVRHMETKIWGKPLDKKQWKKGELRSIKYKVKL